MLFKTDITKKSCLWSRLSPTHILYSLLNLDLLKAALTFRVWERFEKVLRQHFKQVFTAHPGLLGTVG